MAHHPSLRAKAIEWRQKENLTIDQLAERLAVSRTTVYYWVRDIPIERTTRQTRAQRRNTRAMQRRFRLMREAAYEGGIAEFDELCRIPTFRDFVCMYIGEGYKRTRHKVSLANSDPTVITLANGWISRFARNPVKYAVQYHADQNLKEVVEFWGDLLDVPSATIRLQRKSNSNGLSGRKWRSRYGVLTVWVGDTLLRARLQGWIDCVKKEWV
jgi:hypothetical protein